LVEAVGIHSHTNLGDFVPCVALCIVPCVALCIVPCVALYIVPWVALCIVLCVVLCIVLCVALGNVPCVALCIVPCVALCIVPCVALCMPNLHFTNLFLYYIQAQTSDGLACLFIDFSAGDKSVLAFSWRV